MELYMIIICVIQLIIFGISLCLDWDILKELYKK